MKKETQTKLYFTKSACFIITYLFILVNSPTLLSGQNEIIKENFTYPDMTVTTYPQFPAICNPDVGVVVTCNEEFLTYEWQHRNGETESGKVVTLNSTGTWLLTVTKENNGVICTSTINFVVYDLIDPLNIKTYFEEAGFYPIPIWREQLPGIQNGNNNGDRNVVCTLDDVKFQNSVSGVISLSSIINNTLDNFKPIKDLAYSITETNNPCLCELGIEEIEKKYISSQVNFWGHQYFASNDSYEGIWFIKMNLPGEEALPIPEQAEHLKEIHPEILSQNDLTNQVRVFISNLIMAHPIGGYDPEILCSNALSQIQNAHILTPGNTAVKIPQGSTDLKFSTQVTHPDLSVGRLIEFSTDYVWRSYYSTNGVNTFYGYYYDVKSSFYESFECEVNSCNECVISIASMEESCDGSLCSFGINDYTSDVLIGSTIFDGGYGYELSKCDNSWITLGVSEKNARDFVYNLLCAIKNGDPSISFSNKMVDKVIFAKDIYIGEAYFPFVGIVMPKQHQDIILQSNPELKHGGTIAGFEYSFQISNNNSIRLNFFSLGDYKINDRICSKILDPSYEQSFWFVTKYPTVNSCLSQSLMIDEFKRYISPPNTENLLIFVNGYRFNESPVYMAKNFRSQYEPKSEEDAVSLCNDNYEGGNYWNNTGSLFVNKINNRNVVYIDGHYNISSSNHYRMFSYLPFQTSFASSLLPCLTINKTPYQLGCNLCSLNSSPNHEGFAVRYERGKKSGQEILSKITSGKIKIKRDALGRLLGKIDIVAHSMGYAHAKGVLDFLKPYLAVGNTFGNFYVIAPENAKGHETSIDPIYRLDVSNFESVFQYGSNFTTDNSGSPIEGYCRRDGVAPQVGINGLNPQNTIFIPTTSNYNWMRNFINAHKVENYTWLFTDKFLASRARVKKRN